MKPFSKKTNEEIYLEWLNDYLTIEAMADNYAMIPRELEKIIDKGRNEHLEKFASDEYKKIWLPLRNSSNEIIDILEITK
jgi:hypothetical protein